LRKLTHKKNISVLLKSLFHIFKSSSFNKFFKLQARRVEKQGVAQQTAHEMRVVASCLQFGLLARLSRGIQTQLHNPALARAVDRYMAWRFRVKTVSLLLSFRKIEA